jgi:two-component system response regulator AtoC
LSRARLLIVDDKPSFLALFEKLVGNRMEVRTAPTGNKALGLLALEEFDVVVSDVRMPGIDGLDLLREIRRCAPQVEVILVTGYGTIPQAVAAMQAGAFSYLTKPFDPDEALALIESAVERKTERERLRRAPPSPGALGEVEARSDAMLRTLELAERAASSTSPVLLLGEVGSGKRWLARHIHASSSRRAMDFALVEARGSELLSVPEGGTALVADLELLSPEQQRSLLVAIDSRRSVRWIAGAHEPLDAAVEDGRLLPDLLSRFQAFPIALPPLRERQEDIPLLTAKFLQQTGADRSPTFTSEALAALVAYDWPGNVRELAKTVNSLARDARSSRIGVDALPAHITRSPNFRADAARLVELSYREVMDLARDRTTRDYLVELLNAARGNVTRAAQRAAVERESLHRLMRRYHLRAEDFRDKE